MQTLLPRRKSTMNLFLIALSIGPVITLFYLLPFLYHGFLNYYYISSTIVIGLLYLLQSNKKESNNMLSRKNVLLFSLLFIFGASISWPLLIPALVMIVSLYAVTMRRKSDHPWRRSIFNPAYAPLAVVFLLQFVPIYFQLRYSTSDATQGINLTGGITILHTGLILVGLLALVYFSISEKLTGAFKQFINNVFQPLYILIAGLVGMQYFIVGEVRYYAIKSAYILEVLLLVAFIAWLISRYSKSGLQKFQYSLVVILVPIFSVTLLNSLNSTSPFSDVRSLLRPVLAKEKPAFFDSDIADYKVLAKQNLIQDFNTTTLHYDADKDKLYTHPQVQYWSNMMTYGATNADAKGRLCSLAQYTNLAFGTFTIKEQAQLSSKIRQCAMIAHQVGRNYYIITDGSSKNYIEKQFGDIAEVR